MSRRGWVLFALMSVLWGIPYLMIKVAVEDVSVPVLVFARTALGAALLLPFAMRAGGFGMLRRHWKWLVVFSLLEILGPWALLSDAERTLSSSMTGLLIAAVPIVGVLVARLAGDAERLGPARWAGLLLGLAGVAVLAAPHLDGGSAWSIGEVMLVVLGYSTAPLIATRKLQDVPSLPLTTACLTFAALVYMPPAIVTWPDTMPNGRVLAALAGLGVLCTALAFMIFLELIREVGTSRAMVFTYVNPAVAVVAGVVLLSEPLTATIAISFILILCGSVLATVRQPSPPPPTDTPPTDTSPTNTPSPDTRPADAPTR
ncbi:DMT family transporter [Actinomadura rudentiformis]|uniref:DMT family transporter n=1 Tax=Actinomadura rudentiformis TaxID=359158 RepID=A0A6H9YHQ1_9ACTN|nr:DMT family transporter [Actinomadura rudentiformis]KAB2344717.1 DMT family transporter [Actinomadura rudentiformis]